MVTATRTYSILILSDEAYNEIQQTLKQAGYEHAFHEDGIIDMHGIAVRRKKSKK